MGLRKLCKGQLRVENFILLNLWLIVRFLRFDMLAMAASCSGPVGVGSPPDFFDGYFRYFFLIIFPLWCYNYYFFIYSEIDLT
jgi:hypothetical protein